MGYQSRDYAGTDDSWRTGAENFKDWPVWKKLVAINIAVFLLQIFWTRAPTPQDFQQFVGADESIEYVEDFSDALAFAPRVSVIQKWFELDATKVLGGQVWRLVTCGFCHSRGSMWHILMNMLFLVWFGARLESKYGSREFAYFYFASLIVASLAYIGFSLYTHTLVPAIGASGAVWGVVALYALLYPHETIRIYFLFPVPIWLMAMIYFLFDLHPLLLALSGDQIYSGVGHAAHVGGAVFGFLYYKSDWRLASKADRILGKQNRWANSSSTASTKPRILQMHGPYAKKVQPPTASKMVQVLEKISSQGRESLTDEEELFLQDASRRLREKN